VDLRSSPLGICCPGEFVILCVQDLHESAQGASLSSLYNLGFVSIYLHISIGVHSALCVLGSSELQNLEVPSRPIVLSKSCSSGFGRLCI